MYRFLLLALLLPLAACDSGDGDDGPSSLDCERLYGEEAATGTFAATVDGAALPIDCITAVAQDAILPTLEITGYVNGERRELGDVFVNLSFIGPRVGTITLDNPNGGALASGEYSPDNSLESFASESGTFTISELTDTRVRGSFSFIVEGGTAVTDGSFDVTYFTAVP